MKYYYIAQAYGSGNYGQNTYTGETSTGGGTGTSTGAGTSTNAGGARSDLANTGIYVLAIVSLACLLIFLALIARFVRRKKTSKNLPAVIPGQRPVDTPIAPQSQDSQASQTPQPVDPEQPQPTKRIDF